MPDRERPMITAQTDALDEPKEIKALARAFEQAETVEVHSGDREPGATLTAQGKKWVVAGLRLLAKARAPSSGSTPTEPGEN
jgi:hypothetical protein